MLTLRSDLLIFLPRKNYPTFIVVQDYNFNLEEQKNLQAKSTQYLACTSYIHDLHVNIPVLYHWVHWYIYHCLCSHWNKSRIHHAVFTSHTFEQQWISDLPAGIPSYNRYDVWKYDIIFMVYWLIDKFVLKSAVM